MNFDMMKIDALADQQKRGVDNLKITLMVVGDSLLDVMMGENVKDETKRKAFKDYYYRLFKANYLKTTGVDFDSNLVAGTLVITKYQRFGEAKRWRLVEGGEQVETNPSQK